MTLLHKPPYGRRVLPWIALTAMIACACGEGAPAEKTAAKGPHVANAGDRAATPEGGRGSSGAGRSPGAPSEPREPIAVAIPTDELELGDEPDDAPHVDRALRIAMPRVGDRVIGRGFVVDGVPDDVTAYWPEGGEDQNVYVIYDARLDHVATIVEEPAVRAAADRFDRFDPGALRWESGAPFAIWPSDFAGSQRKRGPGQTTGFDGPRFRYRVDTLVPLPWLTAGFRYRVDPPSGA